MSNLSPPITFWIVSAIMLVWNLLGIAAFIGNITMNPEVLAAMTAEQRALHESVPPWATAAFAVAVFGGTLGCIALLVRKAFAVPLFVVSLLGVLVQMSHAFVVSNTLEVMGPISLVMPVMITVVAVFLIWFSYFSRQRDWIA